MSRYCSELGPHDPVHSDKLDYCRRCGLVLVSGDSIPLRFTPRPRKTRLPGQDPPVVRPLREALTIEERAARRAARRRSVFETLAQRDEPRCFYCGVEVTVENYSLDHYIPRSKGGPNGLVNRRLACVPCDRRKGSQMPDEFEG